MKQKFIITADVDIGPRQGEVLNIVSNLSAAVNQFFSNCIDHSIEGDIDMIGVCIRCLSKSAKYRNRQIQYSIEMRGLFADAVLDGEKILANSSINLNDAMIIAIEKALTNIDAYAKRESITVDIEKFKMSLHP